MKQVMDFKYLGVDVYRDRSFTVGYRNIFIERRIRTIKGARISGYLISLEGKETIYKTMEQPVLTDGAGSRIDTSAEQNKY